MKIDYEVATESRVMEDGESKLLVMCDDINLGWINLGTDGGYYIDSYDGFTPSEGVNVISEQDIDLEDHIEVSVGDQGYKIIISSKVCDGSVYFDTYDVYQIDAECGETT